jgi:hypothetical protein
MRLDPPLETASVKPSWKLSFWAQWAPYVTGVRTSVIRPMRKVKPRWRPLTYRNGSLIKLWSVHKTIVLVFKSKSKYNISTHSLPRWRKLKELFDVSSSPFLLFLSARLTRSWLHFLDSSSRSSNIYGAHWPGLSNVVCWFERSLNWTVKCSTCTVYVFTVLNPRVYYKYNEWYFQHIYYYTHNYINKYCFILFYITQLYTYNYCNSINISQCFWSYYIR